MLRLFISERWFQFLAVIFLSFFCSMAHAQIEQCFDAAPIPDGTGTATPGTPYISTVTYDDSDFAFTDPIIDFNFNLAIDHTWVGDLIVTLTSPIGTTVTLIDRPGTPPGTFGCGQDNVDTLLDDEAALPAEGQCTTPPAVSGALTPTDPLSAFDGEQLYDEASANGTWTLTVTDNAGFDTGAVLGTSCIDGSTTTPVTINNFESEMFGGSLRTKWQTSSETFNVGFNVWGLTASQKWKQLNNRIIKSMRGNTLVNQNYKKFFNLNRLDEEVLAVGISSISSTGKEDFFGPFDIGEEYGSSEVPDYIDWKTESDKYKLAMQDAGYVYLKGRFRKEKPWLSRYIERRDKWNDRLQQRFPAVNLVPSETGMHSVTYADLKAAGVDWKSARAHHIAVSLNGEKVGRIVSGTDRRGRITENSRITFAVAAPEGENKRYVANNIYQLSVNLDLVSKAKEVGKPWRTSLTNTVAKRVEFGENKFYANNMPGAIPWLDTELFAWSPQTASYKVNFDVEASLDNTEPARLTLKLLGGIDYPNVDADGDGVDEPDHHVRVYLNRADNQDPIWEGFSEGFDVLTINAEVAATLIKIDSANELEIEVVADSGNPIDIMSFDEGSIDYFVAAELSEDDSISFSEPREGVEAYQFLLADQSNRPSIYGFDNRNHLVQFRGLSRRSSPEYIAFKALEAEGLQYQLVNSFDDLITPIVEPTPVLADDVFDAEDIELLIIADAAFINADLQRFADFHRIELDRPTKIISAQDIYDRFGYSMATPDAINRYLKFADETSDYTSVLLVGGHTFNYLGFNLQEGEELINSIPGFYADINDVFEQQAPTENPFVDLDGDSLPDKAIGRWPVRNAEQLKNIVDKTIVWHQDGSIAEAQSALLIAASDPNGVFKDTIEELIPSLGGEDDQWTNLTKVYVDDIISSQTLPQSGVISEAQQQIKDSLEGGRTLAIYNGHGSPTRWGFQNLVTPSSVNTWDNAANPTMMLPLACYTSYYESQTTNTLAHQMLLADDNAAVAISSAAVLATEAHNKKFVELLLVELTQNNLSLGEGVLKVKRDLLSSSTDYEDIVTVWTTLADPTLSFHKVPVEQVDEVRQNFNDSTITSKDQLAQ